MSAWADQQVRDEAEAARLNLAALEKTLGSVQAELDDVRERFGQIRAQRHAAEARMVDARERGAGATWDTETTVATAEANTPTAGRAANDMAAAMADSGRLLDAEGPLNQRAAQLEKLAGRLRVAVRLEGPRVEGLTQRVAALDTLREAQAQAALAPPEPDPVTVAIPLPGPAAEPTLRARLVELAQRFGSG